MRHNSSFIALTLICFLSTTEPALANLCDPDLTQAGPAVAAGELSLAYRATSLHFNTLPMKPGNRDSRFERYDESERRIFQVFVKNGLLYDYWGRPIDTDGKRYDYVMDANGNIYLYRTTLPGAKPGKHNHPSALAGAAAAAAGGLAAQNGRLTVLDDGSGHYAFSLPFTGQTARRFEEMGADLSQFKVVRHNQPDKAVPEEEWREFTPEQLADLPREKILRTVGNLSLDVSSEEIVAVNEGLRSGDPALQREILSKLSDQNLNLDPAFIAGIAQFFIVENPNHPQAYHAANIVKKHMAKNPIFFLPLIRSILLNKDISLSVRSTLLEIFIGQTENQNYMWTFFNEITPMLKISDVDLLWTAHSVVSRLLEQGGAFESQAAEVESKIIAMFKEAAQSSDANVREKATRIINTWFREEPALPDGTRVKVYLRELLAADKPTRLGPFETLVVRPEHRAETIDPMFRLYDERELKMKRIYFLDGRAYKADGRLLGHPDEIFGILVMDQIGNFYFTLSETGKHHHSSFDRARPAAPGMGRFKSGILTIINNHSGHYHPGVSHLEQALARLKELGVEPVDVERITPRN